MAAARLSSGLAPLRMRVRSSLVIDVLALDLRVRAVCFVPLLLAIAIALAIVGDASIARADARARAERAHVLVADAGSWRPILAGCLGVFFGAAIAVWHIKGSRRS